MIHRTITHRGAGTLVMDAEDKIAFVDSDWVRSRPAGSIPALRVDASGSLWWESQQLPDEDGDPAVRASRLIAALAADAAAAVTGLDPGRVRVSGAGVVAAEVRRLLRSPDRESGQPPLAVIETSGELAEFMNASRSLADGGLLVIAGELVEADINLYSDAHRRGLQLLGIPGLAAPRELELTGLNQIAEPVSVAAGDDLPPGLWYRVSGDASPD